MLLTLLSAAAAGCGSKGGEHATLDVVRVASHGRLSSSAVFIADEEGFFRDEGIRVDFIDSPRSTQSLPLLERGDLDVLGASASAGMFAALAKGARFRIVADRGHLEPEGCDYDAIMGSKTVFHTDSPGAEDMRGKSFSVNGAGTAAYVTDMYLRSIGLTFRDVHIEKLNETVEAQALESGALDALHVAEPFTTRLREEGHRVLAHGGQLAPGAHISLMLFAPTLVEGNRQLGVRFMKAYLRGVKQYSEGMTERNIQILAKRGNYEAAMLRSICPPKIRPDGEVSVEWISKFQAWAVEQGFLDHVLERGAGIDMTFAREATALLAKQAPRK